MVSMATAQEMLNFYLQAEISVLQGQSVRYGERQLTRADLEQIQAGRLFWQLQVDREARPRGASRVGLADFGGTT
jgi:hypothetical protein